MVHSLIQFLFVITWYISTTNAGPWSVGSCHHYNAESEGRCEWDDYRHTDECDLTQVTVPGQKAANDLSASTKRLKGVQIAVDAVDKILTTDSDKIKDLIKGISFLSKMSKFAGPIGFVLGAVGDIISMFQPQDNSLQEYVGKIGEQLKKCIKQEIDKAIGDVESKHLSMLDMHQIKLTPKISPRLTEWASFQRTAFKLTKLLTDGSVDRYEKLLPAISTFVQLLYFGSLQNIYTIYQCIELNDINQCNPHGFDGIETIMNKTADTLNIVLLWSIKARDAIYYYYKFPYPVRKGMNYKRYSALDYKNWANTYTETGYSVEDVSTNRMVRVIKWDGAIVPPKYIFNNYMVFAGTPWDKKCLMSITQYTSDSLVSDYGLSGFCNEREKPMEYYDDNFDHSMILFYQYHTYITQINSYLNFIRDPTNSSTELILVEQDVHCSDYVGLGTAENPEKCEQKCIEHANKNKEPCIFFEYANPNTQNYRAKHCSYLPTKCKDRNEKHNWYNVFARVKQLEGYQIHKNSQCKRNDISPVSSGFATNITDCIRLCYAEQSRAEIFCKWVEFDKSNNRCYHYPNYDVSDCDIIEKSTFNLARVYDGMFFIKGVNMECKGKEQEKGKKDSVEICAEECKLDAKCKHFIYAEAESDWSGKCWFEEDCTETQKNEHYNLYTTISLIDKGKRCEENHLDSVIYVSPKACYMYCMSNGYKYAAFGNEAKSKPRQCICYTEDTCTDVYDFDFDLYSTDKTRIACPEKYKGFDNECCYGQSGHEGLDEDTAKMYCDRMSGMEWIPKDYAHNNYACCIKGSQSISYFVDVKSWIHSHFLLSNILVAIISCLFVFATFVTIFYINKQCKSSNRIKYHRVEIAEDKMSA